jgi:hypothetical protein
MAVPLKSSWPAVVAEPLSISKLEIVVLHTNVATTVSALKTAAELALGLAPVRLLAVQVVPYPLSLNAPPISVEFLERRFAEMAQEAAVEATVDIRLARDAADVVESEIGPHNIVVIGGRRRRWWPTAAMRLARRLERLGHQVVFTN